MGQEESKAFEKNHFFRQFPASFKASKSFSHPIYGQGTIFVRKDFPAEVHTPFYSLHSRDTFSSE
jgi:hypothetical protein